jgi:CHASE3 domain sensor protein
MNSRLIRVLLVLLAVGVGIAAAYFLKTIDTRTTHERQAADAMREHARALSSTLFELRAAQVAYVARGQVEAFWMDRVSKLLPTLDQQLADFKAVPAAPAAQSDVDAAAAAIENFHKLDARAEGYVKSGDPLLASDLIFSDGLEAISTAAKQIEAGLEEELAARDVDLAALRKREIMTLGGGAGAMVFVLVLLGFTGQAKAVAPKALAPPETLQPPETFQQPKALQQPEALQPREGLQPPEALRQTAEPVAPVKSSMPNLALAADLCTDLARVHVSRQLPALLERAAAVLDASGIIVWIAEAGGHELRPATSFGYSDQAMARMGSIPRDAANAVAAAYRSGEMRTVNGDGFSNGALVVPLLTADGCIGVLSAEMKGGSEKDGGSQALGLIFAAQLATLVSPSPSAALNQTAIG